MSHVLEPHSRSTAAKLVNDLASNPELSQAQHPVTFGDHHRAQLASLSEALKTAQNDTPTP